MKLEAIEHLLHLHACEEEGIASGQPTTEQWREAVEKVRDEVAYNKIWKKHVDALFHKTMDILNKL